MDFVISSKEQLAELWTLIYQPGQKPDWSHILPYYHPDIHFRDSVQEIHGIEKFSAMTARLAKRSASLEMEIRTSAQSGQTIMLEWIMTLRYKNLPNSSIFGASRVSLDEQGKIIAQRDYYDLWGDIYDNIPFIRRIYRGIMFLLFG
jgi:limonene-1,2-epoxide hydrolase